MLCSPVKTFERIKNRAAIRKYHEVLDVELELTEDDLGVIDLVEVRHYQPYWRIEIRKMVSVDFYLEHVELFILYFYISVADLDIFVI